MWCIINKINNEKDAFLYNTQQNELIQTSYINVIDNRILSKNNRFIYSPQSHIKLSNYPIKKIKTNPPFIAYKFISNYNYNYILKKERKQ